MSNPLAVIFIACVSSLERFQAGRTQLKTGLAHFCGAARRIPGCVGVQGDDGAIELDEVELGNADLAAADRTVILRLQAAGHGLETGKIADEALIVVLVIEDEQPLHRHSAADADVLPDLDGLHRQLHAVLGRLARLGGEVARQSRARRCIVQAVEHFRRFLVRPVAAHLGLGGRLGRRLLGGAACADGGRGEQQRGAGAFAAAAPPPIRGRVIEPQASRPEAARPVVSRPAALRGRAHSFTRTMRTTSWMRRTDLITPARCSRFVTSMLKSMVVYIPRSSSMLTLSMFDPASAMAAATLASTPRWFAAITRIDTSNIRSESGPQSTSIQRSGSVRVRSAVGQSWVWTTR